MLTDEKPLFTLSIGEYIAMTEKLINKALESKEQEKKAKENEKENNEHLTISQLSEFLHCSKVSIHKYKKKGMPFYRVGKKLLFKKIEILNFMRSMKSKRVIEV